MLFLKRLSDAFAEARERVVQYDLSIVASLDPMRNGWHLAKMSRLKAVDFFCSGGGMSCGMQQAGLQVLAGIDVDLDCKATYESNICGAMFIQADIQSLQPSDLKRSIPLEKNDKDLVFIGCSPCQYWSIMRTDKTSSTSSKNLLPAFQKHVQYYRPGYVVLENVPGILNRADESGLTRFIKTLNRMGYGAMES